MSGLRELWPLPSFAPPACGGAGEQSETEGALEVKHYNGGNTPSALQAPPPRGGEGQDAHANTPLIIAGYASLFGVPDLAGDIVERGAFARSLKDVPVTDIRMLFQHDPDRPIGRWTGAYEDSEGLWMQGLIDLVHPATASVLRLIRSGAADGLSIGFRALDAIPRPRGGRILKTIDLREVSVVTFPMLPRARLRLRADQPFSTLNPYQQAA